MVSIIPSRTQFVEISQTDKNKQTHLRFQSSVKMIKLGLILGPLLFLIYINDLPLKIKGVKLILYVDDTNILTFDKNQETLQTKASLAMKQLENWFLNNNLVIKSLKQLQCPSIFAIQSPFTSPKFYYKRKKLNIQGVPGGM